MALIWPKMMALAFPSLHWSFSLRVLKQRALVLPSFYLDHTQPSQQQALEQP